MAPSLPWVRDMLASPKALRDTAARNAACEYQNQTDSENCNLLAPLVKAKDPETGQTLEEMDVAAEVCISRRRLTHHTRLSCRDLQAYI